MILARFQTDDGFDSNAQGFLFAKRTAAETVYTLFLYTTRERHFVIPIKCAKSGQTYRTPISTISDILTDYYCFKCRNLKQGRILKFKHPR